MPILLILFALFVLLPAAEIATFILVGEQIGVIPTILLTFATAIAGAALMRHQGLGTLAKLRAELDAGRMPGRTLGDGAMILAAGMLLLVPGFLTDILGLLLFVPAIREAVWWFLSRRMQVTVVAAGGRSRRGTVVDLDADAWRRTDGEEPRLPHDGSPWRRPGGR
jgi:UPF0716 protein FxsA